MSASVTSPSPARSTPARRPAAAAWRRLRAWTGRWFGDGGTGAGSYDVSAWIFARLLGVVYLAAFSSLAVQVRGLLGAGGILPAGRYLAALHDAFGGGAYRLAPTLLWLGAGDRWLLGLTLGGAAAAALLALDLVPLASATGAWAAYLSLTAAGQTFLGYQWDVLLVEAGFLALFLVPTRGSAWRGKRRRPAIGAVWLVWWLLFRLLFESGLVKLASGDPTWRHLTALRYHFHTQPLPNPVAYFIDAAPARLLDLATGLALLVELGAPPLLLTTRRLRHVGAWSILGLQLLIGLTGNYGFFNLLTVVLALLLFDDAAWSRLLERVGAGRALLARLGGPVRPVAGGIRRTFLPAFAAVALVVGGAQVVGSVAPGLVPGPVARLEGAIGPLDLVDGYGLFAVMTTTRPEIEVEGRRNGGAWRPYRFRYIPGPPGAPPPVTGPHMPRLDWQMWFAALTAERSMRAGSGAPAYDPWFLAFVRRLLQGSAPVTDLLDPASPFRRRPPDAIRARLFEARFTRPSRLRRTGLWWERTEVGMYLPPVRLGPGGLELAGGAGSR